jgi:hypothetical protein
MNDGNIKTHSISLTELYDSSERAVKINSSSAVV